MNNCNMINESNVIWCNVH